MTNTTAIKSVIATLNAMDVDDDSHELWEKAHDAAEDLLLALEHEGEPDTDEHIVRLANATMSANQIAFPAIFHGGSDGMTLRQYYAGQALAGLVATEGDKSPDYAVWLADRLIEELAKSSGKPGSGQSS